MQWDDVDGLQMLDSKEQLSLLSERGRGWETLTEQLSVHVSHFSCFGMRLEEKACLKSACMRVLTRGLQDGDMRLQWLQDLSWPRNDLYPC